MINEVALGASICASNGCPPPTTLESVIEEPVEVLVANVWVDAVLMILGLIVVPPTTSTSLLLLHPPKAAGSDAAERRFVGTVDGKPKFPR